MGVLNLYSCGVGIDNNIGTYYLGVKMKIGSYLL